MDVLDIYISVHKIRKRGSLLALGDKSQDPCLRVLLGGKGVLNVNFSPNLSIKLGPEYIIQA